MLILLLILLIYLTISVVYLLFFAIAAKFGLKKPLHGTESVENIKFLFMVPAYKEDNVILETAHNLLEQPDLGKNDEIVVIADQLQPETISLLKTLGIKVVEVNFEKSTKSKSINAALAVLPTYYDAVVLLDADNHLVPNFIHQSKEAFRNGSQIIQAHRIAKNLDTTYAKLDAISEEINNSIFRLGHRVVGLSSSFIGSGLVMNYELYQQYMSKIDVISGFDKQMELDLLYDGRVLDYLPEAYVLDEKVRSSAVFETQRTRWLAAQFQFARQNFVTAWVQLFTKGNVEFFNKVLQFVMPPRILLLGMVSLLAVVTLLTYTYWEWGLGLFIGLILSLFLAIPAYLRKIITWKVILQVPAGFFRMVKAVFSIKKAKNRFLHTPHQNNSLAVK